MACAALLHDLKDQIGVLRAVTKSAVRVTNAADAGNAVLGSLTLAQTGRPLPVAVEFPLDVLDDEVAGPVKLASIPATKTAPVPEQVAIAADRLQRAKRTVIYCGGGAVSSANAEAIAKLAEILHAPVLTSIQGKGAIPADNPYFAGTAWGPGNAADDLLQRADCLLVLGSADGGSGDARIQDDLPTRDHPGRYRSARTEPECSAHGRTGG